MVKFRIFREVVNAKTIIQEVYSEPSRNPVYCLKRLTIFAESSILDVRLGSEYPLIPFS